MKTPGRDNQHAGTAIAAITLAVMLFSAGDATAKWLGIAGYASPEIAFFRYLFGLIPVTILVWSAGPAALRTRRPFAHAVRAALMFSALVSLFTGLRTIPLAEAISIAFTAPLFITALSYPVLGERVGPRRWAAVFLGFMGVLIMTRPGTDAFQIEALWILASAFCFAMSMLFTRRLSATETNVAMFTYTTVGAMVASMPFVALTWVAPETEHLWIFALVGVVGGCAAYLMIVAYSNAPAATIAPLEYTALIWGSLFGWVLWAERPAPAVWVGAAIIVACGLYITRRKGLASGLE